MYVFLETLVKDSRRVIPGAVISDAAGKH